MASKSRALRTGYTTGACAAAAAKAAVLALLSGRDWLDGAVEIPFPGGARHTLRIKRAGLIDERSAALASVIKDAGDDPDVTNGAEITALVRFVRGTTEPEAQSGLPPVSIKGGSGVGTVTKPGLAISVGEPAITSGPVKGVMAMSTARANSESGVELMPTVTAPAARASRTAPKT